MPKMVRSLIPRAVAARRALPMHARVVGEVCRVLHDAHGAEPLAAA
ncbi:hypothetical protein ACH4ND_22275 [Streptomyces sp. NPDC017179]